MPDQPPSNCDPVAPNAFFEGVDWVAFLLATLVALIIYCATLTPELDLGYSGISATGALYPGVSEPPGHPLWAIYGWLFIKLWPFGNIAWRLALASAWAAALTCGLIALLVSRMGWLMVQASPIGLSLPKPKMLRLRVVCGGVAGLAFGLDGCVWRQAVVPETWSLLWLLWGVSLLMMTRWAIYKPQQRRWLLTAAFVYGLALSENQGLIPVIFGLPFLMAAGNRAWGRDCFLAVAFLLGVLYELWQRFPGRIWFLDEFTVNFMINGWLWPLIAFAAVVYGFLGGLLAWQTRGIFREWKAVLLAMLLVLIGAGAYFLLPLYSLTNPPMNWGYTRTLQGFYHVVSRGQFDGIELAFGWGALQTQLGCYFRIIREDLGDIYLLAAVIPCLFLSRMAGPVRNWLAGLLILNLIFTGLTLMGLNVNSLTGAYAQPYLAASHLIIVLFAGCGLMLIGAGCTGAAEAKKPTEINSGELRECDSD